jgi:hypothetical protein
MFCKHDSYLAAAEVVRSVMDSGATGCMTFRVAVPQEPGTNFQSQENSRRKQGAFAKNTGRVASDGIERPVAQRLGGIQEHCSHEWSERMQDHCIQSERCSYNHRYQPLQALGRLYCLLPVNIVHNDTQGSASDRFPPRLQQNPTRRPFFPSLCTAVISLYIIQNPEIPSLVHFLNQPKLPGIFKSFVFMELAPIVSTVLFVMELNRINSSSIS